MASVFYDSFDPYQNLLLKWNSGVSSYNNNPAFVRTGAQSFNPNDSVNFANTPRINFAHRLTMTCGFAYFPVSFGAAGLQISYWYNEAKGSNYAELRVQTDGSLSIFFNNSLFAVSVPGVITAGQFNYIEIQSDFFDGGFLTVRVNGQIVIGPALEGSFGGFTGVDSFLLPGNTTVNVYYDDLYLNDTLPTLNGVASPISGFQGAVQIFAILPDLNETPIQWTPLAGTNVSQVNTAPPPGDAKYVFSNTVGNIDQYHYTITGPSGSYAIKAIQHSLCARVDSAGSHTINSQIGGTTSGNPQVGSNAPGSNYDYAIFPWDINPETNAVFQPTDFATTFVGPNLTA
jgi:hypothetical protein